MIDFGPVRDRRLELSAVARGLGRADLAAATAAMTNDILDRLRDCRDEDVVFVPLDPAANDTFAIDPGDVELAWTLGHVIVHLTASSEEGAFLAAELARGVADHGRSRYETPWRGVTTIAACRDRLNECRRMILATLETWPDEPNLEVLFQPPSGGAPRNAVARFLGGLMHADSHREQISEIVHQARAAVSGSAAS